MKKIIAMLLALVMLGSLLAACDGEQNVDQPEQPDQPAETPAGYSVKVMDALGNPCSEGIIVRFMQNGQQVSMQTVGQDGVATKDLPDGEYTVELKFTDSESMYYYEEGVKLDAGNKHADIILYNALPAEPDHSLFAQGKDVGAYAVGVGCTYVKLTAGERNYFLFTPTEAGKYQFSLVGSTDAVGYYGAPHFVQAANAAELINEDGSFCINVKAGMVSTGNTGTTVIVLGIDATADNGILAVQRIGDPDWSVEDEPWHTYTATIAPQPYVHDKTAKLGEFDLTASTDTYTLVLGSDNYYHLNSADGPLVLMRLGKSSGGSKYLADFQTILEHSGINKYFFDDNGQFIKKEDYSQCLMQYFNCMDEGTGLYPLTEDLKYIIQMRGDHCGWFTRDGAMYLFVNQNGDPVPGINSELAWLHQCCFIEE